MQMIPLQAVPSQVVTVSLSNQTCQISIYQKFYGLYCDIYVNNTLIIGGVICQNRNRIKRSQYLAFVGDLAFIDNRGNADPHYTGLGDQFSLLYLSEADLEAIDGT